jgi:hypothetical protein
MRWEKKESKWFLIAWMWLLGFLGAGSEDFQHLRRCVLFWDRRNPQQHICAPWDQNSSLSNAMCSLGPKSSTTSSMCFLGLD